MGASTEIVPSGYLQFESGLGLSYERGGGERARTLTYGSPILRLGVSRRVELRLEGDGYQTLETGYAREVAHRRGWSDIGMGAKVKIANERGWVPALTLVPMISVPSGGDELTSDGFDPSLVLGWSRSLPAGIGLSGAFAAAWLSGDTERFSQSAVVLAASHHVVAGWNGYVEAQRLSAVDQGGPVEWMAGAGASRMVGKAVQVDVQIGHTVGGYRSAWFASVGIALRAPKPLFH